MKQVLLADKTAKPRTRPLPPILMWMGDDVLPGDSFLWRGHTFVVDAIYSTRLSAVGCECRHTDYPRQHRTHGVPVDQHGGESTGVPGVAGAGASSH